MSHLPVRLHPSNPKIFEFRGKPMVVICPTEHYGSVINRPFDFRKYLADAADKKQTMTRMFVLFREMQSAENPSSPCKPDSPDYISPFRRVGPELALDAELVYDLEQWNPEFFERLHAYLSLASEYNIVVEVVLLSNSYAEAYFMLNPLFHRNNINGLEPAHWAEYTTMRHPKLFAWQCAHVRKIVEETNRYDNIIYEICNEPGGGLGESHPSPAEVNDWLAALIKLVRDTEAKLPNQHLVVGQEAFAYLLPDESSRVGADVYQFADLSFDALDYDVVNMHPLSNMFLRGKGYNVGQFNRNQMRLRNLQQYCRDLYKEKKPFNLDEDNNSSVQRDFKRRTIHRKRAWTTLFCGGHYDMIDWSLLNYCETGTPESQRTLRTWFKNLSIYIHSLDLIASRPLSLELRDLPDHVMATVFGVAGRDISIYLADTRELTDPSSGEPISIEATMALDEQEYAMRAYSPLSGLYSPSVYIQGGDMARLSLPEFTHDVVLRLTSARG